VVHPSIRRGGWRLGVVVAVVIGSTVALMSTAIAAIGVKVVSQDPYTNTTSYHATEVEPDTYSFGNTIVSSFQVGRFTDGGASNLGWATSSDGGATWSHGFLPGTTIYATPAGPFQRATDTAVAYDPAHDVWMIVGLLSSATGGFNGDVIFVSRSTDGGHTWGNPVSIQNASGGEDWDKSFIGCDTTPSSPHFGNCYAEWDDFGQGNPLHMSTSTDGGLHWTAASVPNGTIVIGGMPLAQPDGTVVVPTDDGFTSSVQSFVSRDGGKTYQGPVTVDAITRHTVAGGIRQLDFISADVDATGRIYVVWFDCRFRAGCSSNDAVMSTSTDGRHWTSTVRIPIDPVSSTVDHFLLGLGVDHSTGGANAHLGLVFNFYPKANCTTSSCKLRTGYVASTDGGATWSSPLSLGDTMRLTWLPNTTQGYMPTDYNSVSFAGSKAYSVFALARQGTCQVGQITSCSVPMVANKVGLSAAGPFARATAAGRVVASGTTRPNRILQRAV
jgi:hypothetical protein